MRFIGNINNYDNFLSERIKGSIKDLEKFKEFTTFSVWNGNFKRFQILLVIVMVGDVELQKMYWNY